jgi:hypothetical protein
MTQKGYLYKNGCNCSLSEKEGALKVKGGDSFLDTVMLHY